jgi:hypothetical protein
MSTVLTEGNRLGDVVKYESGEVKRLSREDVTVLAGQELEIGAVLGKVTLGSCPTTGTADEGNTGKGTCGSVTAGSKAQVGTYTLRCIRKVTSAGDFEVIAPDSTLVGYAVVAVAFTSDHINFTIADGDPDFEVGDSFTITIPAGSGKVREIQFAGVDGTQHAYGVLIDAVDTTGTLKSIAYTSGGTYEIRPGDVVTGATGGATGHVVSLTLSSGTWAGGNAEGTLVLDNVVGTFQSENLDVDDNSNVATVGGDASAYYPDRPGVAVVRDAVIDDDNLVWPTGATDDQIAAALAELAAKGIITRTAA